jgi:hypothetical protein
VYLTFLKNPTYVVGNKIQKLIDFQLHSLVDLCLTVDLVTGQRMRFRLHTGSPPFAVHRRLRLSSAAHQHVIVSSRIIPSIMASALQRTGVNCDHWYTGGIIESTKFWNNFLFVFRSNPSNKLWADVYCRYHVNKFPCLSNEN